MKLIDNLRYKSLDLFLGASFFNRFKDTFYKLHLGHNKIIGWEDSLPVRTLGVPAEYSDASIDSIVRLYNSQRYHLYYPSIASLSITDQCDCSCAHCGAYGEKGDDLPTKEWIRVIKEATDLGVFSFLLVGGEPLMREDLPEIIKAIDRKRAVCLLYTNGSMLKERVKELYDAGLRRVLVSIYHAEENIHDEYCGQKGLMRKAMEGIEIARQMRMLVGISTISSPERLNSGILERILYFSQQRHANEIAIFNALPIGRWENREDIRNPTQEYQANLKNLITSWWAKPDAPGVWWYDYIASPQNCGCLGGTAMFHVSHSGEFRSCAFCKLTIGSVKNTDLLTLWTKLSDMTKRERNNMQGCWLINR